MARKSLRLRWSVVLIIAGLLFGVSAVFAGSPHVKQVTLDGTRKFQIIDGFGANINPDQWRDGKLKPALNLLVDDLGGTLYRFDCYGLADWLDPARRDKSGRFPPEYLQEAYTRPDFRDAWETFRYLDSKGVKLFLNVSGRIPKALAGADGQTLTDLDGYAEMVVSLAKWARQREKLRFTMLSPFNETDLGFPEGPKIPAASTVPAIRSILQKLDEAGMSDVKLIVMDDAGGILSYLEPILEETNLVNRIAVFATHTYGTGGDEDGSEWSMGESRFAKAFAKIRASSFRSAPLWIAEYGDLDQSEEVEFGVAWRSTRRLLKFLKDGASAGIVWDAYDNFHKHDAAWAIYGLLKTDQANWTYAPKQRFWAAKQVFRYVRPGFQRVELSPNPSDAKDVFAMWRTPLKHMPLLAFISPDKRDFTIVGMSTVESDVELNVNLQSLPAGTLSQPVNYYRTSRGEHCLRVGEILVQQGILKALIKEDSIFTLSTIK